MVARECSGLRPGSAQLAQCRQDVEAEAVMLGDQLKRASQMTTRGLRDVLTAMQALDGPKTLILMSEGFGLTDDGMANELAALAAATRTSIYALKLDNQLFEITNARAPVYEPLSVRNDGLEALTAAARGALYIVSGTGSQLFANIESELSGYYLLGVQSDPTRPRRQGACDSDRCVAPRRDGADAAAAPERAGGPQSAAQSPRCDCRHAHRAAPDVGAAAAHRHLRVAWPGAVQGAAADSCRRRQRLHRRQACVGRLRHPGPHRPRDREPAGRPDGACAGDERRAGCAAVSRAARASIRASTRIKLAVAEGDRIGSVEHVVHATLADLGEVKLSELMVGGPVGGGEIMRPTVGYTVSFGSAARIPRGLRVAPGRRWPRSTRLRRPLTARR